MLTGAHRADKAGDGVCNMVYTANSNIANFIFENIKYGLTQLFTS